MKIFTTIAVLFFAPIIVGAVSLNVFVDTGGEKINALEAVIKIPDGVEVRDVYIGQSAILFWITTPNIDENTRTISFSGITPGGFSGKVSLFTLEGDIQDRDVESFIFSEIRALKNDGAGSVAPVTLSLSTVEIPPDNLPPEDFDFAVGQSPDIFDGKYFLVFNTQDKGMGIDHYEVREGYLGTYRIGVSPYLLDDQSLSKKIFVKAVDKRGNEKVSALSSKAAKFRYLVQVLLGIMLIGIFAFSIRKLWIKFGK